MIAFLLFCILLCLCPPLRRLIGCFIWILVAAWAYGHYLAPHDAASQPAAIEQKQEETKRDFESVYDFLGDEELPPSRQRAQGIEGDLVFPQFSRAPPETFRTPAATEGWLTAPPVAEPEGRAAPPVLIPFPPAPFVGPRSPRRYIQQ